MTGLVLLLAAFAAPQQHADRMRALARGDDSIALATAVRARPKDARDVLGDLIEQAGRARTSSDSIVRLARRLASTYAAAWEDSFPVTNLARFERLTPRQRAAKSAADSTRLAGNELMGSGGVHAALRAWRLALRRSSAIPDTAGMAAAAGNIGTGYSRLSRFDTAEAYFARARTLAGAVGDRRTLTNALGALGSIALERGDLRRADETFRQALALRNRIGDVRGEAADHNNLGLISAELGQHSDARAHYVEALAVARRHDLDEAAATALLNLANVASVIGGHAEADSLYREALTLARASGNEPDVALLLHNSGLLALRRGNYREARVRLLEALRAFERVGTLEDLVQVRRDLATVDAARGDLRSALHQLGRVERSLAGRSGHSGLEADVAIARADLATMLNNYAEADRHYARARSQYRLAGQSAGEAEAQQGRAMLLLERKQYALAEAELETAERTLAATGDRRSAALTRLLIGHARHVRGDTAAARVTLARALDTLRVLSDAGGEAAALVALGDLELDAGSPLAAETRYRAALAALGARSIPTIAWQARAGLGRALRGRGALVEAADALNAAIADVERMARSLPLAERRSTFLADKWDAFADLALIERARGDAAAAFATSERMRARQMLDVLSRGRIDRTQPRDSAVVALEQDLRARIGELMRRLEVEEGGVGALRGPDLRGAAPGETREALARAQEEYSHLLLELSDENGLRPMIAATVAPWRAVATRLSRGQAMLAYLVTDSTTMVFVVTPDTMRVIDLSVSRASLATWIDFARGTMERRAGATRPPAWRGPLRRLHRQLVAPVEDAGLLAGVRQLVIVPHAELHYLPFAALIRSRDNGSARDEYLIERYDVGYAPSASAWVQLGARTNDRSGETRVLALAPRARALPGSQEEVDAIRSLYGAQATVLAGADATEQAFRATVGQYDIVHLASYGVLNQHNPLFSFVELGRGGGEDGRLEVHEVFGLALSARLIVLSACRTALASGAVSDVPAGDDWVGLVRAFLGAGARNVIATLWAVEDRSTARVMERLHRRLRAGDSEAVALSQAQRETLRNPATSGPFYWAGFVMVGAP